MANYRRFAALCLLLLSSADLVFGKIRGNYYDTGLEATTSDGRQLKHMRMKGGMKSSKKGERYKSKEKGVKSAKGGSSDDYQTESPTEVGHTVQPEHTMAPAQKEGKHKGGYGYGYHHKGGYKGGSDKTGTMSLKSKSAVKGGVKGGTSKNKYGQKSAKEKSKGGSKKGGMSKYKHYGKAIEKKSHSSYSDKSKAYHKSKDKLQKSANGSKKYSKSGYYTDEPTEPPVLEPPVLEPTLVEVPMSFFFKFEDTAERRRLDGHVSEPTPEELEILKTAVMEYAVGLFNYLHEAKPDTFYSVTPSIGAVMIHPEEEYPLQVDITFHVLYNEAPEDAPGPDEVAGVLTSAFTTQEFVWYYLWGHDSIWESVASVNVVSNVPADGTDPSESTVNVMATMVYSFGVSPNAEATDADYDTLVSLTETFFSDLLTDLYKDNSETTFESLSIDREATTFDLDATPPVLVDFAFHVEFDENSAIVPSSDFLFTVMAQTMFDDYIRLYLEPSESIWSTVDRVALLEFTTPPEGPGPNDEGVLIPPQSAFRLRGTMVHSFFSGMAVRPGKEDYDKLEMATNFFFSETLSNAYSNNTDTVFLMATTQIDSTFFDETAAEPLQVNYDTSALFEGLSPEYDEVFNILQNADYEDYIMNYLWDEGEPWTSVNGVMYVEQIPSTGL